MQKLKSLNLGLLSILKAVLVGIVFTLIGIVLFAVVLKFTDLSLSIVNYVNDIIKAVSIFVIILIIKRANPDKLLIKSIVAGLLYAILSFVIFSILNGAVNFNMSAVFDLLFSVIVAVIASVFLNLFSRKTA